MTDWTELGGWITFALALSAFIFSALCYKMLLAIYRHVMKFDPSYRQVIDKIHEDIHKEIAHVE